jgi:hypothetical protein
VFSKFSHIWVIAGEIRMWFFCSMKQKLLVRMLSALLLVVCFGHGHASRRCIADKPELVSPQMLAVPSVHFGPLDVFKW